MIELRGVRYAPGGRPVLSGVDLEASRGEIRLVVGASGAGKTSLLRIVAGLAVPDAGTVSLDGRVVTEGRRLLVAPHRRRLAMVFQEGALWDHMTVEEHLRFGLAERVRAAEERDRLVEELLRAVGLLDRRRERPGHLSGGERQRLGLARALALRPRVLLLDEPLAHVDARGRRELGELIAGVVRDRGLTTLWVTHRPDEVVFLGGALSVLAEGRIERTLVPREVPGWLAEL